MVKNNQGITLTELLSYLAIIGIVAILLTTTLIYALRTYDQVKGQGALNNEASNIMTKLLHELNKINVDYIERCDEGEDYVCVVLVNETEKQINDLGIIEEVLVNEQTIIKIETGNIYVNNTKLNNDNYYVKAFEIKNGSKIPNITYEDNAEKSYDFILKIRLEIYEINKKGEKISRSTVYENRFSFIGK